MLFTIDLTTIATNENSIAYAYSVNREFELGIADSELATLSTFSEFAALPSARSFFHRAQQDASLAQQIDDVIDGTSERYRSLIVCKALPVCGACEKVTSLAHEHQIIYVTRRAAQDRALTIDWLATHGFPYSDRVYCCSKDAEKLIHALYASSEQEPIMLVDSDIRALVRATRSLAETLPSSAAALIEALTLLAFQCERVPALPSVPFPVLPLPNWDALQSVLQA